MLDNRFQPAKTTVTVGTEVTSWEQVPTPQRRAVGRHVVDRGRFDRPDPSEGHAATLSFYSPRIYAFFSTFHGNAEGKGMAGTLTAVRPEDDT